MRTAAYRLMLVLIFTLPWENVVDVAGVGRVSKLVGLVVAWVWVLAVATSGRVREPNPVHIFAILFVLWNSFTLLWSLDFAATQERLITYAQLLGLLLVLWDTVTDATRIRHALAAYLAGCYVTVAALLGAYFAQGGAEGVDRVTAGSFHPNDVGMILALGVPIVGYLLAEAPGPRSHRWPLAVLLGLYLPLAGAAVLVTGSRAGVAAMVPGFVYLGYLMGRRHPFLATLALAVMVSLAPTALSMAPEKVTARLESTQAAVRAGDLNERGAVWAEGVRLIAENPLLGSGSGAFRSAAVGVNKVGHNFALTLLAEVGVIGFGLFMAMLVTALLSLRRVHGPVRGFWVAIFSAWLFAAMLHNWEYRKQTWFFIALLVAAGSQQHAPDSAEQSASVDEAGQRVRR